MASTIVTGRPRRDDPLTALRPRRDRLVADLASLVECESPSGDLAATSTCGDIVAAVGSALLGAVPERIGPHLRWRFGIGVPRVLLLGHLDTVWPVGTLARWPFDVDGDRASGPGCFDMKAGLVQMFHALSVLPSLEGVSVLVTADEELGAPSSRGLVEQSAYGATAVLVTEPSAGGALKTARKGIGMYRVEVTGRAAHAGLEPERGASAGVELAHQVLALAAIGDPARGTTVTPTVLAAGTTTNTVPATGSVAVDVRAFEPDELARVDGAIHALRPVLPGTSLTVHDGPGREPMTAAPYLLALATEVAATLGLPAPRGVAVGGASDGNLTAAIGVPTLDGLGAVGGNAHAEGEWVDTAAMPERAALLAGLVARLVTASPEELGDLTA